MVVQVDLQIPDGVTSQESNAVARDMTSGFIIGAHRPKQDSTDLMGGMTEHYEIGRRAQLGLTTTDGNHSFDLNVRGMARSLQKDVLGGAGIKRHQAICRFPFGISVVYPGEQNRSRTNLVNSFQVFGVVRRKFSTGCFDWTKISASCSDWSTADIFSSDQISRQRVFRIGGVTMIGRP